MVRRNLLSKKKTKVSLPRPSKRRMENLDEPMFEGPVEDPSSSVLAGALNYYNYLDLANRAERRREWTLEYVRTHDFTPDEVDAVSKMEDWRISNAISAISRMANRGVVFSPEILSAHDQRIRDEVAQWTRKREVKEETKEVVKTGGPRLDRFTALSHFFIGSMEELVDAFVESGYTETFSPYEFMTKAGMSGPQAKAIGDHYTLLARELGAAKKGDRQMKEAYPLGKVHLNSYEGLIRSIVEDAGRYAGNKRTATVRKPRKRKEKDAAQLVQHLHFLKEFPSLKLVSVDPASIVGSTSVWLYNVKYKTLRRLQAADNGDTLTIRGSTVHGYDEGASEMRTLRKPDETIKRVLAGTSRTLPRVFDGIKTKPIPVNGRINDDTIILRTIR